MTKIEFYKIASALKTYYPRENILPNEKAMDLWYIQLKDISYSSAQIALNQWVATNRWSPAISDIREKVSEMDKNTNIPSEMDAWAKTRQAIGDSNYHSQERFAELPEICQRIVESPDNLQRWALMDTDELESVVMSQFLRNYRIVAERMKLERTAPEYYPKIEKKIDVPQIEQVDVEQEMSRGIPMPDGMMEDVKEKLGG